VHAAVRCLSFLSNFIHMKPRYVRRTALVAVLALLGSLLTGVTFAATADAAQKSPSSKAHLMLGIVRERRDHRDDAREEVPQGRRYHC